MYGAMALGPTHDCMQFNVIGKAGARELARALEHNAYITHLNMTVRGGEGGGLSRR